MYKVEAFSYGKSNNVAIGPRYTITFKSALSLAKLFHKFKVDFKVTKFERIHGDVFCWTDALSDKQNDSLSFIDDDDDEEEE